MANLDKMQLTQFQHLIDRDERVKKMGHRSFVLWFTGLSAAGKSTLASLTEKKLFNEGCHTYILDGDSVRQGLCKDLGFTNEARVENIRRVGEVARLMIDAGLVVMTAFISPFRSDRRLVRTLVKDGEFIEVFVKCPLSVCEARDPKGLYKKAREGLVKNFTGIDSEYEEPEKAEIVIDSEKKSPEENAALIVDYLRERKLIR